MNKCSCCLNPSQFVCSKCTTTYYCNEKCQKMHFNIHSPFCKEIVNFNKRTRYCNLYYNPCISGDRTVDVLVYNQSNSIIRLTQNKECKISYKLSAYRAPLVYKIQIINDHNVNVLQENDYVVLNVFDIYTDPRVDSFTEQVDKVGYGTRTEDDLPITSFQTIQEYMLGSWMATNELPKISLEMMNIEIPKIFIPSSTVVIYRGMVFKTELEYIQFVASNDVLKLTTVSSWSSNICVANYFATTLPFGVIIEHVASTDEILVDTRYFDTETLEDLYYSQNQREIILKANLNLPRRIIYRYRNGLSVEDIPERYIFEDGHR